MTRRFDRFIEALASVEVSDRACNQYSRIGDARGNAIRRRNLRLYFQELDAIGPRTLLIGEAPSYRGGRLTGIAFVSETVLLSGVEIASPPGRILGADHGYRKATDGPRLSTEASATMVWSTIRSIDPLPISGMRFPSTRSTAATLTATACPHPPSSKPGSPSSNGFCDSSRSRA